MLDPVDRLVKVHPHALIAQGVDQHPLLQGRQAVDVFEIGVRFHSSIEWCPSRR